MLEWGIVIGISPQDISEKISKDIFDGSRIVLQVRDNVYVWFYSVPIPLL